MKNKNIILFFLLILFVIIFFMSAVHASDITDEITNNVLDSQDQNTIEDNETIEVVAPKSDNNYLSNLTVDGSSVSGFSKKTANYNLGEVENSKNSININATPENSNASVSGTGTKKLSVGNNTFSIVVTAESGSTKTYTINITRKKAESSSDNDDKSEEKSSNNYLNNISVDVENLTPTFSKYTTTYYLIVDSDTEKIDVNAIPEDSKAKVNISGYTDLQEGENTVTILVTAEDKSTRTYTIHVTKTNNAELANANLKNLSITNFNISPTFDSNVYSYDVVLDELIDNLGIEAIPENDNATVEISGNNNLKEGENLITITVTAEDEETKKDYFINVTITLEKLDLSFTPKDNTVAKILGLILGIAFIICAVAYLIIRNTRRYK